MIHILSQVQQEFLHELNHSGHEGMPMRPYDRVNAGAVARVRRALLATRLVQKFAGSDGERIRITDAGRAFVEATR